MVGVSSERNSAESAGDWVVANTVVCVPGTNVRAAPGFLAKKVDAEKEAIASNDGWAEQ